MRAFVAVQIGCIECGEPSAVLGIFTKREAAQKVCDTAEEAHKADWHGQRYHEIFEAELPNV